MLTIDLPAQAEQTAFNLRRWDQLLNDPEVVCLEGRVEKDRHGHILMSPPPAPNHGSFQYRIARELENHLSKGRIITECPISTADGVKAADIAWASADSIRELGNRTCFPRCPEICVEVLSPANSSRKVALYFDAGAREVWLCDLAGRMSFLGRRSLPLQHSKLCPKFPKRIVLSRD